MLGTAPGCEYYDCGECVRPFVKARIENVQAVCDGFKARTRRCGICKVVLDETRTDDWHNEGNGSILCWSCYALLYKRMDNLREDRKALKDLVARVRKDEHSKCPSEGTLKRLRQDLVQGTGTHA